MATPTRLAVLLQTRKSANAGRACAKARTQRKAASTQTRCTTRRHVPMVGCCVMPGGCEWRRESRSVNDDSAEIIDVGGCRTRRQQVAQPREEPRGIVVGEKGGRIEAAICRTRRRGLIDHGAGRIVDGA